jgi:two-component system copper resistance phosphate regulon response regulator CusR
LKFAELTIDLFAYKVYLSGNRVFISPKEFELLRYLTLNKDQVLTKEQIY